MAETELVRLGHLILDGTPAEDDPEEQYPLAKCDVTLTDACRAA